MKKSAVIILFAMQFLITACSPEEEDIEPMSIQPMDIPLEEFGFEDGFLEFSKTKYYYDTLSGYYSMYFSSEFFDYVNILFSPYDETLISHIHLSKTFSPDEHGRTKFLQVSEILKSFYGKVSKIELHKEDEHSYGRNRHINKQIWKINGNIIELRSVFYPPVTTKIYLYLDITFHPEVNLQVLE